MGRRRVWNLTTIGVGGVGALASIDPALGDTFGGVPVTLSGTNLTYTTGVLFGVTAATSVVVVNSTTVTCIAPALAAGNCNVTTTSDAGTSNAVTYEAWSPLVDYADARVYQADQEVTSAFSATRHRTGTQDIDILAGTTLNTGIDDLETSLVVTADVASFPASVPFPIQIDAEILSVTARAGTTFTVTRGTESTVAAAHSAGAVVSLRPNDGEGFVELASGRFLRAGGAPIGHAAEVVNTILYSDDRGKTWAVLLADAPGSSTRPAPGHTLGFFTLTILAVEYVYWIGGDPFTPTGDVFRSADGGSTWTRISTTCPTSGLALFMYGFLGTDIYIIGGQVDILDGAASKTVHKSTDYGVTWTTLAGAFNCPADVWGTQLGPLPVKDGCLWVCGSGRYDSVVNDFSNGVFKFDGTTWTEVLANGHAQFLPSRYHSAVADANGRLWRFNGTTWDDPTFAADSASAHYSDDGVTWTSAAVPWGNTHAQAAIATSDGIYVTEGFQSPDLYVIREHTGALVSAWGDQGSANLDASQSVDGTKPILDTTAFGTVPGLAFTKAQALVLAAPDRDLVNGHYEVFFVGKLLDLDASAAQGPNPPVTVVGSSNGSTWNNAGFDAGALCYEEYSAGYLSHNFGGTFSDDVVRLYGFTHETGSIKAWVGATQVGSEITTSTFDTSWTGWDCIGGGYSPANPPQAEDDYASIVLGAVVVLTPVNASSGAFRTKLATWARKWGAAA